MEDAIQPVVEPLLATLGLELVDLDRTSQSIRITVDCAGGADLDTIAKATRAISDRFDELDLGTGRYTLEVSSPGVERRLRTAVHFAKALGEKVTVKLLAGTGDLRRVDGLLSASTETSITITTDDGALVTIDIADIDRARTVFTWGSVHQPTPSKGKPKASSTQKSSPSKQSGERAAH